MAKTVQSLRRALAVVDVLASSRRGIGVSELSRKVHLPPSTVHRLLATLNQEGYAMQSPGGKYRLGHKVVQLGGAFLENFELREFVRPYLEELVQTTGETANLVIVENHEAFYLDKVDSPRVLRVFNRIGYQAPLYCTAAGKVLLSGYSEVQLKRYLKEVELVALTANTITSRLELRRELQRVRQRGFAYDVEECEEGACCAAVPLKVLGQRLIAALSISGPAVRLKKHQLERATKLLKDTAARMSEQIE